MADDAPKQTAPRKSGRKSGPKVLGVTRDGVRILKPPGGGTHFTQKEAREAVAAVLAAKR
ncbi:MAG TPA: hypothetical protein VGG29_17760 [Caulobacteraceae bacterium]|jgi:hypothetical protein